MANRWIYYGNKKTELAEMPQAVKTLWQKGGDLPVWRIDGRMGGGKTTLIKHLAAHLSAQDPVSSPTFSIVHEYAAGQKKLYHFDCYRLNREEDAYEIGLEEYLDSGHTCLIEWGEKIKSLLPEHYFCVKIKIINDTQRAIAYCRI